MNPSFGTGTAMSFSGKWGSMVSFLNSHFYQNNNMTCDHFVISFENCSKFQKATNFLHHGDQLPLPIVGKCPGIIGALKPY